MSSGKIQRQYGLWDSPLAPIGMARGMGFADVAWGKEEGADASPGALVWLESRGDRSALVVQPLDGEAWRDLNSEYSVRAKVGYGGGDFSVSHGQVFFVEAGSGRIFSQPLHAGVPRPLTPAFGGAASPKLSPDGRWLLFVHTYEGKDHLVITDSAGEFWPQKLVSGDDFYMQPAWHPDGQRVAWVAWSFPNMPWDGTNLHLGALRQSSDGLPSLESSVVVAGGEDISIFQPEFSPNGRYLAYVSDESGWWQLYLYDLEQGAHRQLTHTPAEHGIPAWVQGQRTYAFSPDGSRLFFLRNQAGINTLWQLDLENGQEQRVPLDERYTGLDQLMAFPAAGGTELGMIASGGATPARMITCTPDGASRVWRRSASEDLPASAYAIPEPVSWQGLDGGTAYGLFFPPHNPRFEGIGKPPLLVNVHGGPTSQVRSTFNPKAQFFATRGYAYLEVNYRGSTGYGRQYRNMLRGSWGVYDVQDAVSGARSLAEAGRVDAGRMVILGGSAGGLTVLLALEQYPGFFKAGVCSYGVSNQFALAAETHKFEARYNDLLLGPLPEAAPIYRERSPIFAVDKIQDPLAVFQGEDDRVVPRAQSDTIVESLRRRGVPHEYHLYPGEGHGFRKPESIEDYYTAVEKFLRQYVIFA